jgi:hypothetical protein
MNRKRYIRRRLRGERAATVPSLIRHAAKTLTALALMGWLTGTALVLSGSAVYAADAEAPARLAVESISQVVSNIRLWLVGILGAWATLCLTVGFFRYSSGEAGEVEKGKFALRCAAVGYAGALIAPLIVTIVGSWVA